VACEWGTVRNLKHLKLHTPAHISRVINSKEKACCKEPFMNGVDFFFFFSFQSKKVNKLKSYHKCLRVQTMIILLFKMTCSTLICDK